MSAPENAEGNICVGCGLCCDGTLHGTATVQLHDEANVTAAGLEIATEGKKRFFRQPCPNFSCGSCTVYAIRPEVCRTYRCALLINLEAGRISEADAREKVATAKKLLGTVRSISPDAVTPAQRTALTKRLKAELAEAKDDDRESIAKALLDTAVLEHFLNRWFFEDKDEEGRTGA